MRKLLTLLFMCSGLAAASLASAADGVVSMSWDTCVPPIDAATANKAPGTAAVTAIFSVVGNDQAHKAHAVRFVASAADRTTPDAWRFDAAGCQTDAFITLLVVPPGALAKACPAFKGANNLDIKAYAPAGVASPYQPTQMLGTIASAYDATPASVPATTYFLGGFVFDHTFSVNGAGTPGADCGGNDIPFCLALIQNTSYLTPDGTEVSFTVGSNYLTYAATPLAGCPSTPARAATWGQIKSQYRN